MNQLDIVILVVLGVGAFYGLARGMLRMATSIVSLVAAIYLAFLYYPRAAAVFERQFAANSMVATAIGYAAVFVLVFIAVEFAGTAFARVVYTVHLGWLDALSGAAVGAAIAGAILGLLLMLMTAVLPAQAQVLRDSEFAPRLLNYTEILLTYIPPEIKDAYNRHRAELTQYWLDQAMRPAASPSATRTK